MHKVCILLVLVFGVLAQCNGYSYVIPANFRTPGVCFYNGRILPKGNSQMPMVCQNTNCREDGSIMVDGCGRISLPNCNLIENERILKPYPNCCAMTYECVGANGSTYRKEWNQLDQSSSSEEEEPVPSRGKSIKPNFKLISPFILQFLLFV